MFFGASLVRCQDSAPMGELRMRKDKRLGRGCRLKVLEPRCK
jgi:hypothetical protein